MHASPHRCRGPPPPLHPRINGSALAPFHRAPAPEVALPPLIEEARPSRPIKSHSDQGLSAVAMTTRRKGSSAPHVVQPPNRSGREMLSPLCPSHFRLDTCLQRGGKEQRCESDRKTAARFPRRRLHQHCCCQQLTPWSPRQAPVSKAAACGCTTQ